jgi:hypothetical protein
VRQRKIGKNFFSRGVFRAIKALKGPLVVAAIQSFAVLGMAQEVTVKASVDRNQMRPGDTFTYSISISSEGSASFDAPRLPDLSGFEVLSSWQGSEMRGTFVNGQVKTQRSQNFNYMLSATREGSFTIGSAEVVVGGQSLKTNPIQIQVSPSAPQGPAQAQQNESQVEDEAEDLFSQLLRRRFPQRGRGQGGGVPTQVDPNEAFFIHVDADKSRVYAGEQVTVSWYLVTRMQIADIDTLKYPSLSGFWKEDIEVSTRLNFRPEVINGVQYQRALLASYALFPIKPGMAKIDEYRAKCRVIGISAFGAPHDQQITKESPVLNLEVLDLPAAGRPESFTAGVGDFTVTAKVDVPEVAAKTPVTYKVRLEGRGNAKTTDLPKLKLPETVQVYDPKAETKFFPNGRSYKEFEVLLVPKEPGVLKIPPLTLGFFDPEKKSYYTQTTSELTVNVTKALDTGVIPSEELAGKSKNEPTRPTLPELILLAEEPAGLSTASRIGVWGGLFAMTAFGLVGYGFQQVRRREKRENLKQQIQRRLITVRGLAERGDWRSVGVESTNLVSAVLGEIAGLGGATFEFAKLVEQAPPSFKREVAPSLQRLVSRLEILGFAPESVVGELKSPAQLKKLIDETELLLLKASKYDFSQGGEADRVQQGGGQ